MRRFILVIVLSLAAAGSEAQKFEGLTPTPPMGWNSWNRARVFELHDLWGGEVLGTTRRSLRATVPPHDVLMMRLERVAGAGGQGEPGL